MIDLDTPCLIKDSRPVPLFNVLSAVMVGASLLTGRDRTEGYEVYDRDVLEFQLRIVSDPDFNKPSIGWQRFGAYEDVSLFELVDLEFAGSDNNYLQDIFVPEMLEHGRTDNDDNSAPDTWQVFHLEDREVFEAQAKLLGIKGAPPVPRGRNLEDFAREYLVTMDFPYQVDSVSPEFQQWMDDESTRLVGVLSRTVEAFTSHDLNPAPGQE